MNRARGFSVKTTSSLFLPTRELPEANMASNLSHKLMLASGLLRQSCSGVYHLLPLGQRALDKLSLLVDQAMASINASKMSMPFLTPASLWRTSGRWKEAGRQLFRLKDWRGADYCLGPTHEEAVTSLLSQELTSSRQLPLRLYQLDRKFRDEDRPRNGLLRCREFWMKDLYTFDKSIEVAMETYHSVCAAYDNLLVDRLGLPVVRVEADPGDIGGSLSHEYHLISSAGTDPLLTCSCCGAGASCELIGQTNHVTTLPNCSGNNCQLSKSKGIEIAHSFLLGTKYSAAFDLTYKDPTGQPRLVEMGCYGVGVSRLLAAALEVACERGTGDRLVWPRLIAPFSLCVIPLVHEAESEIMRKASQLCSTLEALIPGEVVLEDRVNLTLGARRRAAFTTGYPLTVLLGRKTPADCFEILYPGQEASETVTLDTLTDIVTRTLSTSQEPSR